MDEATVLDFVVRSLKVGMFSVFSMDNEAPRRYSHGRNYGIERKQGFAADLGPRKPYAPYGNGMKKGPSKFSRNMVWTSKESQASEGNMPRKIVNANASSRPPVLRTGSCVSTQPRTTTTYGPRSSAISDTRVWGSRDNISRKTTLCKYWKAGNCKRGEQCQFLHSWSCFPGMAMVTALEGHKKDLRGIAFPEGSDKLFSVSSDGALRLWDCHTGQCAQDNNIHEEPGCLVSEGPWVFLGMPNAVKAFNVQTSQDLQLEGVVGQVHAIIGAKGMLFAGTSSGSISVWKATDSESEPFKYFTSLQGHHNGEVTCFIVGRDRLYSGSVDRTIKVWDLNTLQCIATLKQHTNTVTSLLCWDHCLISSSLDGTLKIWENSKNGSLEVVQTRRQEQSVHALYGMTDAEEKPMMFCSYQNGTVSIFDLPSFEERGKMFSKNTISTLTCGPGGLLFSGDKSGNLRVWTLAASVSKV